jgi:hypothetical protein
MFLALWLNVGGAVPQVVPAKGNTDMQEMAGAAEHMQKVYP